MQPSGPTAPAAPAAWAALRASVHASAAGSAGGVAVGSQCVTCRGPARRGCARCFHCQLQAETAPGLLADVVAPAALAVKGGDLARDLWLYKSQRPGARQAQRNLLALALVFLHDRGAALWAGAGLARPAHACAVPSGRGRPGPHPLRSLLAPFLRLPWVELACGADAGAWGRLLDPGRFRPAQPVPPATLLLLDDTWVSGGSAQSAAAALKLAGARSVVLVVLGRHVAPARGQ